MRERHLNFRNQALMMPAPPPTPPLSPSMMSNVVQQQFFQLQSHLSQCTAALMERDRAIDHLQGNVRSLQGLIGQQNQELQCLRQKVYSRESRQTRRKKQKSKRYRRVDEPMQIAISRPVTSLFENAHSFNAAGLSVPDVSRFSFPSSLRATPVAPVKKIPRPEHAHRKIVKNESSKSGSRKSTPQPGETYHRSTHTVTPGPPPKDPNHSSELTSFMLKDLGIDDDLPEDIGTSSVPASPPLVPLKAPGSEQVENSKPSTSEEIRTPTNGPKASVDDAIATFAW